jgi:hypothetical protein
VDEWRGNIEERDRTTWVRSGIKVESRLCLTVEVDRRPWRSTRRFFAGLRDQIVLGESKPVITTDSFKYNNDCIWRGVRNVCLDAQVEKAIHGNKVLRVVRNYVIGAREAFDEFFAESCDSKKVNTSYIERLNLFKRNSCAALGRKTYCAAKVADALLGRIEHSRRYSFRISHSGSQLP